MWKERNQRHTRVVTCDINGSEPYVLVDDGDVSHYTWKSEDELLCFTVHGDGLGKYYLYKDKTTSKSVVGEGVLRLDGHPSYSPDQNFLLLDTYPDRYGDRNLLLYDLRNDSLIRLGAFFSPRQFSGDLRCDLHPRWSPSGRYVVFDSSHERQRQIYIVELPKIMRKLN